MIIRKEPDRKESALSGRSRIRKEPERRVMGTAIMVLGPTVLILILPAHITETDRGAAQLFSFHVHGM